MRRPRALNGLRFTVSHAFGPLWTRTPIRSCQTHTPVNYRTLCTQTFIYQTVIHIAFSFLDLLVLQPLGIVPLVYKGTVSVLLSLFQMETLIAILPNVYTWLRCQWCIPGGYALSHTFKYQILSNESSDFSKMHFNHPKVFFLTNYAS